MFKISSSLSYLFPLGTFDGQPECGAIGNAVVLVAALATDGVIIALVLLGPALGVVLVAADEVLFLIVATGAFLLAPGSVLDIGV